MTRACLLLLAVTALVAQPAAEVKRPAPARGAAGSNAAAAGASYKDLKYPPLHQPEIPKVDAATLGNGMRLYLLEDHELPLIEGTALVRTGTLLDPPDKAGLANLTVTLMRSGGAGSLAPDQVDDRLEDLAGTVETTVGPDSATFTFSSLKESSAEVLAIFKAVLTAPQFSDEKIEQARADARNAIAHRNDDAGRVAHRELADSLFGRDTPLGREPDYASVSNIQRGDLEAFHTRYFFPRNIQLAIRGDFDSARMKAQIDTLFGGWHADQPPPEFPKLPPAPADAPGIHVAVKKDVSQTFFAIGQIGGTRNEKDYAALEILADILGGDASNRLAQSVRAHSSQATVSARWEAGYNLPGLFEISGSITSVTTAASLKAIQEEVARIRSSEVTDEELRVAKDAAINSLVFAFDTKAKILDRVLTDAYYGYPADFIDQYQNALAAVTRADVLRVARERLKPETFATVLVGDPADFIPPVESLNQPVQKIDLTIPEVKITPVKPDTASLAKGRDLLTRLQEAVGGLGKLAAVKDSILVATYLVEQAGHVTTIKHTERWLAPMHYREENELGGGTITSYYDGQFGWITVPGGSVPLIGDTLQQMQGNAFRQMQLLLQGGTLPGTAANAVDSRTVEITGPNGQWARVSADPVTGLPARIRYQGFARSGPPPLMEENWSDFREVAGIKVPFKIFITEDGRKYADVTVNEFRVNSGLKLADLEKRP